MEITRRPARCLFGNAPSLWDANRAYGYGTAQEWLAYQITDLSEFSGARDKITDRQLDQLIQLVTDDYGFLSLAEFMLFCRRFKRGLYCKFYGSVDPISIMQGLNEFCREREEARRQQERQQHERTRWLQRHSPLNVSHEEYLNQVKQMQSSEINSTK